jgi:ribonuclease-3
LYERFGNQTEGDLSRIRANLVQQQALFELTQSLNLAKHLRLGEGELRSGGLQRPSILADALEALIGAIFLDGGFEAAASVVRRLYEPHLLNLDAAAFGKDPKTQLQEFLQARKVPVPTYTVMDIRGAAHSQEFEVECAIPKYAITIRGTGASRRAGEQAAAKMALLAAEKFVASLAHGKAAKANAASKVAKSSATTKTRVTIKKSVAKTAVHSDQAEQADQANYDLPIAPGATNKDLTS